MSIEQVTIFVVDDDPGNLSYVRRVLRDFDVKAFDDPKQALLASRNEEVGVIVADQRMPDISGVELVRQIARQRDDVISLIISAYTEPDDLVEAVNSNVIHKYIVKPFSPESLLQDVQRAIEQRNLRLERDRLASELRRQNDGLRAENEQLQREHSDPIETFAGTSTATCELKRLAVHYARTDQPILITGETGTGKEVLARAIHAHSPRAHRPFVPINCAAFSRELVESELFGHVAGAFTGAGKAKKGLFRIADGGTLLLDEIADLPPPIQPKILRVLQFGTFYPVGAESEEEVDVRIISATNRSPELADDDSGRPAGLREDLFYRLNALHIHIPPLRERPEDIMAILARVAARRGDALPQFDPEAERLLGEYAFRGNVRELENIYEKLMLYQQMRSSIGRPISGDVVLSVLPTRMKRDTVQTCNEAPRDASSRTEAECRRVAEIGLNGSTPAAHGFTNTELSLTEYLGRIEQELIERVLAQEQGNVSRTAALLGLSRQGLKNKMQRYGITR